MSIQPFFLLLFFISPMVSSTSLPPSPSISLQMDTNMTALQMHVAFFDRDNDGLIYPKETYEGFRAIGCGVPLATVGATFIHLGLSSKTRPGQPPSASFPIEVRNIARGKHGSDSGVYDAEGRFVPDKFEKIFQEHSHTKPDALTGDELSAMLKSNRERQDYGGRLASWTEWKVLYTLCKDKDGMLQKETIRAVYDGSLFHQMEKNKSKPSA